MPKINCCICSRRTDTPKQRTRVGTASVWSLVWKHAERIDLDISQYSEDDYICMKCYSTISQYRLSDRGPNKKIKIREPIVFEPMITKEALRGYAIPLIDTLSNITTDNDEESSISIESVVDAEVVGPYTLINPIIVNKSDKLITLWDDCMSFPFILVRKQRHASVSVKFVDDKGKSHMWENLDTATSELLQHEIDHLDGILALDEPFGINGIVSREIYEKGKEYFDQQVDYVIQPTL